MKKTKKNLLITSALVSVCCCFSLVACGDDEESKPKHFDAPKNVTVSVDTLSWDEVSGAAQYTVRINSDETTVVGTTELDLTTVTAKLAEGENILSVKVNATSEKLASAYSTSVTYTYAPSTRFDAPTITLNGDTVSWNAIADAVGYTVKINSDETTVVETTKLDLTTVTTKLVTGNNTIAVKTNAVDGGKQESDYSNAVTYAYTPAPEAEAADYKALVTAIGSITEESTATQAATVKAAIAAAENKYSGMSADAKALDGVVADKAAFDEKKEAFDGVYIPAKAAYDEFAEALTAATAEVTKAQSLTALTGAKTTAETKKYALNALAESMITAEQSTAYTALATTITEWTTAIADARTALAYSFPAIDGNDEQAEANIAKAAELLELYDEYAEYIKAVADVDDLYKAITAADVAAKARLAATVDGLRAQLPEQGAQTLTKEYHAQLATLKTKVTALGEYAATLWTENDAAVLDNEIARVEHTPVETLGGETYSLSGVTLKVTVFRTFINCLGDKIGATDSNAPVLAVAGNTVSVEQQFTKNALNEYVAVIEIENTGAIADGASYTVTLGDSEDTESLNFGATLGNNPFFTNTDTADGFKSAVNDDGNLVYTFQNECEADNYYLDIYMADAVTKYGPENAFVKYTQMPLGTIDLTGWSSPVKMADLKRYLAREYENVFVGKGEISVRFAIYGTKVDGDTGTVSFTAYNPSVISGAITFDIVENDKYYTLPSIGMDYGIWNNENNDFSLITVNNMGGLYAFINDTLAADGISIAIDADNAAEYIGVKFEAVADDGATFTKIVPLQAMGYSYKKLLADWSREYYFANPEDANGKRFGGLEYYITYCILDTAPENLKTYFPVGERKQLHDNNEAVMTKVSTITLDKVSLILPNTGMNKAGTDYFEFLRDSVGNGKLLSDGDAQCLEIKFCIIETEDDKSVETNVNYAYLYNVDGNAVIYKNKADAGKNGENIEKLEVGNIGNAYTLINTFRDNFAQKYYTVDGYPLRWDDGWTFTSRYVIAEDSEKYLFGGEWSAPIAFDEVSYEFTSNTQVRYADNGAFAFFEGFTPAGSNPISRGAVFTTGAVDKVELHFYQGESETTAYGIYMLYNADTEKIEFYYDNAGVKTAFVTAFDGGDDITNGWCQRAWMEAAIKEYFAATAPSVKFTGNWTMYTVSHLRDGSKMFNNGDENGNVKSDTFEYTSTLVVTESDETSGAE